MPESEMETSQHDNPENLSNSGENGNIPDPEPSSLAKAEETGSSGSISPEVLQYLIEGKPNHIAKSMALLNQGMNETGIGTSPNLR